MSNKNKKVEEMRVAFLNGIKAKAREFANAENSIPVQAHHMMAAICDKMASAFVFDLNVSAEINNMKADLESIRRIIGMVEMPKAPEA